MTLEISPLARGFVAEVGGVDLARALDEECVEAIRRAFLDHSILVFHDQRLDERQHIAFSRRFGELEVHTQRQWCLPDHPEILALANRGERGTKPIVNGGAYWHSDVTYKREPPLGSLLYALAVPPAGGDTLFADMYVAWESLDPALAQDLEGLRAVHRYADRYREMAKSDPERPRLTDDQLAALPDVSHPLVRTHPETGRRALFVNEGFTVGVEGMSEDDGRALLARLFAHSTQPRFVYRHRWKRGDLVMWDNRCTVHRATDYDPRHERRMHRTTIRGDVPV